MTAILHEVARKSGRPTGSGLADVVLIGRPAAPETSQMAITRKEKAAAPRRIWGDGPNTTAAAMATWSSPAKMTKRPYGGYMLSCSGATAKWMVAGPRRNIGPLRAGREHATQFPPLSYDC